MRNPDLNDGVQTHIRFGASHFVLNALLLLTAVGCSTQDSQVSPQPSSAIIAATTAEIDRDKGGNNSTQQLSSTANIEPKVEIFAGDGRFVSDKTDQANNGVRISGTGDITLNFAAMDVRDIAKVILGDYLKLNYEIAANVQGSITLQTSRPLQRTQVLPILEQVLRLNGMALVHTNNIYKVVIVADAHSASGPIMGGARHTRGYGIEVIPVRYISASEMQKLLEPIAPAQGVIHIDTARNVLIVEGTEEERQTLREDVALFDTNWLSGMSYALYTPNFTNATEMVNELNQVLGGNSGPIGSVVKLVPIDRLNSILAISSQAGYLEQLRAWVARLDRPGQGTEKHVYVYAVQNGRATDLASTISKALLGNGGYTTSSSVSARTSFITENATTPSANVGKSATPTAGRDNIPTVSGTSMSGATITADEPNNALVILASPGEYSIIEAALRKLDVAPLQVYLEAAIAEITLNDNMQFGVQYFYKAGTGSSMTLSDTTSSALTQSFPGFSYMFTRGSNISLVLNALTTRTHVEVVSSPQLMVLNNQTATLQVGDRVPIATEQTVSTVTSNSAIVNSIQYQDTGVILKVTPRVNHSGMVMLDITQEVSEVTSTTSSSIDSPTIQQRKISSTVAVPDGETFALGGLIKHSDSKTKSGLPYLQRIPLLGYVFGDNNNVNKRTELMVLITPHVINGNDKARAVTEELRRKLSEMEPLLEQIR